MKTSILSMAAIAAIACVLFASRDASALGPVGVEAAAKAGGGSSLASNGPNPLAFGLGARAGVSFLSLYGGATILYYFGESQSYPNAPKLSVHTLQYGLEGGLNVSILGLATVRPQLGFGNLTVSASATDFSQSSSNFYLEPGVVGIVPLGLLFVGADVNILWVPSLDNSNAALTAHAQVGVQF